MAMRFVNVGQIAHHLHTLEEEDFVVSQGKVDIAILFVVHGARKIRSHNTLPISIVLLVKFLFYILCNILKKKTMY